MYPGTNVEGIQSGNLRAILGISGNARSRLKFANQLDMPSKIVRASSSDIPCNPNTVRHVKLTLFSVSVAFEIIWEA